MWFKFDGYVEFVNPLSTVGAPETRCLLLFPVTRQEEPPFLLACSCLLFLYHYYYLFKSTACH